MMKKGGCMTKYATGICIMLALLVLPAVTQAQQKGIVELNTVAEVEFKEINAKGEKEVKRADAGKTKVVPGDVVVYTTTYKNTRRTPVESLEITNPIPDHMLYIDLSAEGRGTKIEFSVDHGKTYGPPTSIVVTDANGMKRGAGPKDYTHLKWTVQNPVPPGGVGTVSYKARLQ
jgi:uncharacterized repeat protein (TIGR01451 family)